MHWWRRGASGLVREPRETKTQKPSGPISQILSLEFLVGCPSGILRLVCQPGLFSLYLIQPELQTLCQMCPMIVLVSFRSRSSSLRPFHLRSRYQTQVPLLPPLLFQGPCDWSGDASDLIPDSRGGTRSEKLFFPGAVVSGPLERPLARAEIANARQGLL